MDSRTAIRFRGKPVSPLRSRAVARMESAETGGWTRLGLGWIRDDQVEEYGNTGKGGDRQETSGVTWAHGHSDSR